MMIDQDGQILLIWLHDGKYVDSSAVNYIEEKQEIYFNYTADDPNIEYPDADFLAKAFLDKETGELREDAFINDYDRHGSLVKFGLNFEHKDKAFKKNIQAFIDSARELNIIEINTTEKGKKLEIVNQQHEMKDGFLLPLDSKIPALLTNSAVVVGHLCLSAAVFCAVNAAAPILQANQLTEAIGMLLGIGSLFAPALAPVSVSAMNKTRLGEKIRKSLAYINKKRKDKSYLKISQRDKMNSFLGAGIQIENTAKQRPLSKKEFEQLLFYGIDRDSYYKLPWKMRKALKSRTGERVDRILENEKIDLSKSVKYEMLGSAEGVSHNLLYEAINYGNAGLVKQLVAPRKVMGYILPPRLDMEGVKKKTDSKYNALEYAAHALADYAPLTGTIDAFNILVDMASPKDITPESAIEIIRRFNWTVDKVRQERRHFLFDYGPDNDGEQDLDKDNAIEKLRTALNGFLDKIAEFGINDTTLIKIVDEQYIGATDSLKALILKNDGIAPESQLLANTVGGRNRS
jgi:hypothetical protein